MLTTTTPLHSTLTACSSNPGELPCHRLVTMSPYAGGSTHHSTSPGMNTNSASASLTNDHHQNPEPFSHRPTHTPGGEEQSEKLASKSPRESVSLLNNVLNTCQKHDIPNKHKYMTFLLSYNSWARWTGRSNSCGKRRKKKEPNSPSPGSSTLQVAWLRE